MAQRNRELLIERTVADCPFDNRRDYLTIEELGVNYPELIERSIANVLSDPGFYHLSLTIDLTNYDISVA